MISFEASTIRQFQELPVRRFSRAVPKTKGKENSCSQRRLQWTVYIIVNRRQLILAQGLSITRILFRNFTRKSFHWSIHWRKANCRRFTRNRFTFHRRHWKDSRARRFMRFFLFVYLNYQFNHLDTSCALFLVGDIWRSWILTGK